MKLRTIAVAGAASVLWASVANAQQPNLSGKWAIDAEKTAAANPQQGGGGGGGGGGGRGARGGGVPQAFTLTVDANTFTRESEGPQGPVKLTFKLDGSEQTVAMGQGEAKVTAKWEGSTLVVSTTRTMGENAVTTKEVYSLDGDFLVIERTQPGRGGGEPQVRKTYFKKG
jgi:hypothetical protein